MAEAYCPGIFYTHRYISQSPSSPTSTTITIRSPVRYVHAKKYRIKRGSGKIHGFLWWWWWFGNEPGLRVGYLCYDFNNHPTAHMVEGLFHHHKYPVYAYSYGKDDNSTYRHNIISLTGPRFIDLVSLGHVEAVQKVRDSGPHIVVDLQGYTLGTRTELMAMRLAPIQVSTRPGYKPYPSHLGAYVTSDFACGMWL